MTRIASLLCLLALGGAALGLGFRLAASGDRPPTATRGMVRWADGEAPSATPESIALVETTGPAVRQRVAPEATPPPAPEPPAEPPAPPVVLGLDAHAADAALLRWQPDQGARYVLCAAPDRAFAGSVTCFEAGNGPSWPVGAPAADGAILYLRLQGCRREACSAPVEAGAIGRRKDGAGDLYAVALPLGDGRVRLGAFARAGEVAVRYYRARAGTAAMVEGGCASLVAGQACEAVEVAARGSLVGVGATSDGIERGLTFEMREPPTIAFMFDDGTGIVAGGKYLVQSVLDEHGVTASFFLTGQAMQTYPAAVAALVAGGHRVGNHTWSHPKLTTLGDAAIGQELDRTEAIFRAIVPGATLRPCFRAPHGDFNARVLAVVNARGYRQFTQNVSSEDYLGYSAETMTRRLLLDARDGAIVAFHTQMPETVAALRRLVPLLLAQGFRFVLVC